MEFTPIPERSARRVTARILLITLGTLTFASSLSADDLERVPEDPVTVVAEGSSARSVHKTAIGLLPLAEMPPENRERVEKILRNTTVYRELPTLSFEADPRVYAFFASCPDVAVSVWRVMDISSCKMSQTGATTYEADSGDGCYGTMEILHQSQQHNVVLCHGVFKTPMLVKPVKADAVFHVQTQFTRNQDGKTVAKHRGHLFVSFPSLTVGAAAKLMTPVNNVIIDRNFHEISVFLNMMSTAMQQNPEWVAATAAQLDGLTEIRKSQLVTLASEVNATSRERMLQQASGEGAAPHGSRTAGQERSTTR